MKKGYRITAALCCMAIAMPMTVWAAELPAGAEAAVQLYDDRAISSTEGASDAVSEEKAASEGLNIEIRMNENKLTVNGEEKTLRVPAYISKAGYTMLPIREVTEVFPYTNVVWEWCNQKDTATVFHGARLATVRAGADEMYINGAKVELQNTAEVRNGRMFISLRDISYICGILDKEIHWDAATKTVRIAVPDVGD